MTQAIKSAEKDIPNYRINPRVMMDNQAGRAMSRYLQNSLFSNFGRYNNNRWRAVADIVSDMIKGKTGQERIDAAGKAVALAALVYFLSWPMSAAIQKLTGKKEASSSPIGPAAVVDTLKKGAELFAPQTMKRLGATDDQVSASQLLQSMISVSPVVEEGVAQGTANIPYTGQTMKTLGDRVQHAASTANPLQVGSDLLSGKDTPTEELLRATIGLREHKPYIQSPANAKKDIRSEARREATQPFDRAVAQTQRKLRPLSPDANLSPLLDWLGVQR